MKIAFPFISLQRSIVLLRLGVALIFFLHAIVRIFNGSIPEFAGFLNERGFVYGTAIVWILTAFEITGSILLAFNYSVRCLCAGFILILLTGIVIIHAALGWFVGEHGTGGMEYSFVLILALLVVAANDKRYHLRPSLLILSPMKIAFISFSRSANSALFTFLSTTPSFSRYISSQLLLSVLKKNCY